MSNKQTDGGSATPEGKPTPEELALDIGRKLVAAHRLSGFIEATKIIAPAIERRDASWAEEVRVFREGLAELAKTKMEPTRRAPKDMGGDSDFEPMCVGCEMFVEYCTCAGKVARRSLEQADRVAGRRRK